MYLGARKEQTKRTDNTRQLESYMVYLEAREEQTRKIDNTRQVEYVLV